MRLAIPDNIMKDCDSMSVLIKKSDYYPIRSNETYCQVDVSRSQAHTKLRKGDSLNLIASGNHLFATLDVINLAARKKDECDVSQVSITLINMIFQP